MKTKGSWPLFLSQIPRSLNAARMKSIKHFEGAVASNAAALVQEIRDTGELATLLKKSTHTSLTSEEWEAVRAQLLDVLKTIPALAIFALPGGMILLPVLFKVLPNNMRPSSFQLPTSSLEDSENAESDDVTSEEPPAPPLVP